MQMVHNKHTLQAARLQLVQIQMNFETNDYIREAKGEVQNVVLQLETTTMAIANKMVKIKYAINK